MAEKSKVNRCMEYRIASGRVRLCSEEVSRIAYSSSFHGPMEV